MLLAILSTGWEVAYGQCATCPSAGACNGGNGAATNGTNINSGNTKFYSGSGTFGSGINLNGGTLRICGTLTLSSISFNSGIIIIESGGSLTINGGGTMYLNGNSSIYNRGQLTINRNVTMQNSNNRIINCTSSANFTMNGSSYTLELNSSSSNFINYGNANIHTLFIQSSASGGAVCLGTASTLNLTNLNNNESNGIDAPSGRACVRYTGNAALNSNLSNTSNVVVCRATGATRSGGSSFGGASVTTGCTSCLVALPIELVFFKAECSSSDLVLKWATASEHNNAFFTLEKSLDGIQWEAIETIAGAVNSESLLEYESHYAYQTIEKNMYFRLKQTNTNGTFTYSETIDQKKCLMEHVGYIVFPNPTDKFVNIKYDNLPNTKYEIVVYNAFQQIVFTSQQALSAIDTETWNKGLYFIRINDTVMKFVVEH